jgi:hypothetical protein
MNYVCFCAFPNLMRQIQLNVCNQRHLASVGTPDNAVEALMYYLLKNCGTSTCSVPSNRSIETLATRNFQLRSYETFCFQNVVSILSKFWYHPSYLWKMFLITFSKTTVSRRAKFDDVYVSSSYRVAIVVITVEIRPSFAAPWLWICDAVSVQSTIHRGSFTNPSTQPPLKSLPTTQRMLHCTFRVLMIVAKCCWARNC